MKKFIVKIIKCASSLALSTAILSANSTCPWIIHQPKVPKEIKNLKKIN
ncbi:cyclic lactone autoinducer peptide [Clostridioides sp. ES-S-0123-01]|nr:cyclic lactone autoinducer peptide [Clostridioides sp. ES-S-0123-01]